MKPKLTILLVTLALCVSANADLIYGSGESFHVLLLFGTDHVIMSGGTGNYLSLQESSSLEMLSGHINNVSVVNTASASVSGGTIGRIGGSGSLVVSGGTIQDLGVLYRSNFTLSGGNISTISWSGQLLTSQSTSITVICDLAGLQLIYDGTALTRISGDWLDGSPFDIIINDNRNLLESSMHFVPEPATVTLLALGGLGLRRRQRKAASA